MFSQPYYWRSCSSCSSPRSCFEDFGMRTQARRNNMVICYPHSIPATVGFVPFPGIFCFPSQDSYGDFRYVDFFLLVGLLWNVEAVIQKINMQTKGGTTPILYLKRGIKLLVSLFFDHELLFEKRYLLCALLRLGEGSLRHIFGRVAFQLFSAALGYLMTSISIIHMILQRMQGTTLLWLYIGEKYFFISPHEKQSFLKQKNVTGLWGLSGSV